MPTLRWLNRAGALLSLLTQVAAEPAQRAQDPDQQLASLHTEVATLTPEITRLKGENSFYARRVAELEQHNRLLTQAATERAQRVQDQERQLTSLHTEIATLTPEITRLKGENSFYAGRLAELEEHNRLLTQAATERAQRVHDLERQLSTAAGKTGPGDVAKRQHDGPPPPSMMFLSIPKSGTVFTREMLARGLNLRPLAVSAGAFPFSIDVHQLQKFRDGGFIVATHLAASGENLQFLDAFVNRWVIHIRDPRSVLVSWVHHQQRIFKARHAGLNELLLVCPSPPEALFERSFSEQVDWNLENFLPVAVNWIRRWLDAYEARKDKILLTTYADILKNEVEYLYRILDFYGVAHQQFQRIKLERTLEAMHFRNGRPDEWRDALSIDQIVRATKLIGDDLLMRFDWPST